eukprot:CAMPEP_0114248450 /NCGR_PEP_ID=MMETSP0058-20121206/13583_1 /TAXON_ID=36894 /ORGANISM="Pyramimonas parkeae, CCMP726" /LENGTH=47 /DNA_ID= /DNA_START= /DNA_END= /DNA_ORIENTATION=
MKVTNSGSEAFTSPRNYCTWNNPRLQAIPAILLTVGRQSDKLAAIKV